MRESDGCIQQQSESLQFDHHAHTHGKVRGGVRWTEPARNVVGEYKDAAFGKPPAAAVKFRTVGCTCCILVLVRRRKFHPVVRHPERRPNVAEDIVCATGRTMHNIAADIL